MTHTSELSDLGLLRRILSDVCGPRGRRYPPDVRETALAIWDGLHNLEPLDRKRLTDLGVVLRAIAEQHDRGKPMPWRVERAMEAFAPIYARLVMASVAEIEQDAAHALLLRQTRVVIAEMERRFEARTH